MKEIKSDIFATVDPNNAYRTIYICIPTNGVVKRDGNAVMGAGVAKQAYGRCLLLPRRLGKALRTYGNHVLTLGLFRNYQFWMAFPVKHHWKEKADLKLIERSCIELASLARNDPTSLYLLPRPGCGHGGLDWAEVRKSASYTLTLCQTSGLWTLQAVGSRQMVSRRALNPEIEGSSPSCPTR